jgi:hypothetical protein
MDDVASTLSLCLGSATVCDASGRRVAGSRALGPNVERHVGDDSYQSQLFGKFNSSSSGGGTSTSTTWQAAGVQRFCYNARWPCPPCLAVSATNASCSSASATCSNRVPAAQMTNARSSLSSKPWRHFPLAVCRLDGQGCHVKKPVLPRVTSADV